ncbi:hypothetical protein ACMT4L_05395 [Deinococcus sp. A31D244]|uniref:hypothetical protein n=1 Tax=Deinococcus sp. A31D244 TaxID=3397675 RepID=UPI0039DF7A85
MLEFLFRVSQSNIIPDLVRMGFADGEVEHLARLLDGGDVGDEASGAIGLLDRIPDLQVPRAHPVPAQAAVAFRRGTGLGGLSGRVRWFGTPARRSGG